MLLLNLSIQDRVYSDSLNMHKFVHACVRECMHACVHVIEHSCMIMHTCMHEFFNSFLVYPGSFGL